MGYSQFNDEFRKRTKQFAIDVTKFYSSQRKSDEFKVLGKQLLRSATSVASNFRAAARARSNKEFYSKIWFFKITRTYSSALIVSSIRNNPYL
jgi:hypothetical protein